MIIIITMIFHSDWKNDWEFWAVCQQFWLACNCRVSSQNTTAGEKHIYAKVGREGREFQTAVLQRSERRSREVCPLSKAKTNNKYRNLPKVAAIYLLQVKRIKITVIFQHLRIEAAQRGQCLETRVHVTSDRPRQKTIWSLKLFGGTNKKQQ